MNKWVPTTVCNLPNHMVIKIQSIHKFRMVFHCFYCFWRHLEVPYSKNRIQYEYYCNSKVWYKNIVIESLRFKKKLAKYASHSYKQIQEIYLRNNVRLYKTYQINIVFIITKWNLFSITIFVFIKTWVTPMIMYIANSKKEDQSFV